MKRRALLPILASFGVGSGCLRLEQGEPAGTETEADLDPNTGVDTDTERGAETGIEQRTDTETRTRTDDDTESLTLAERWQFGADDRVTAPIVVDGTVCAGTDSDDGSVYALSAASGTERWRFRTGDSVAYTAAGSTTVYVASGDGSVYALSVASGDQQWRFQVPTDGSPYASVTGPVVGDELVYVKKNTRKRGVSRVAYALSMSDGTEQWQFETSGSTLQPAVVDGTVYISADGGRVYALSAANGTERWNFEVAGEPGGATVADGTVYIAGNPADDTGGDPILYAISSAGGAVKWSSRFEDIQRIYSPVVADEAVYFGSGNGTVYAVSGASGTERWRYQARDGVFTSPAVDDGTVYVGSEDFNMYALSAADGTEQGRFQLRGPPTAPTVVDETIYFGTDAPGRNVYALRVER